MTEEEYKKLEVAPAQPDPRNLPIYVVVLERRIGGQYIQYPVFDVIKVIPCDLSQYEAVYERILAPLYNNSGYVRQMQHYLIGREPDNPFRDRAKLEQKAQAGAGSGANKETVEAYLKGYQQGAEEVATFRTVFGEEKEEAQEEKPVTPKTYQGKGDMLDPSTW